MRKEILFSGFGGQGLILGGIILAEAAVLYQGLEASHNQSYGPEARGGACKSEMVIGDSDVNYPEIDNPDILVALTQSAFDKFQGSVKKGGMIIVDDELVMDTSKVSSDVALHKYPITATSREVTGKALSANIVTLGVFTAITKLVDKDAIAKVVATRVPPATVDANLKALDAGYALVK